MEKPLVTIVALNYNNEQWVLETLESIKNQSYSNFELVIVDDCSTDKSPHIIEQWLTNYNRPHRYIKNEKNLGICGACNIGLKHATGKYFNIIATDDTMLPTKTEDQVEILENSDSSVAMVFSDALLMDAESRAIDNTFIPYHRPTLEKIPSGEIFEDLVKGNFIPAMATLVKKNVLDDVGLYDDKLPFEDLDMWLRISRKYQIIFSQQPTVKYRIRSTSLVHNIKNWDESKIRIFRKHTDKASAIKRLEYLAWDAYKFDKKEAILLLENINSKKIKLAIFLFKLRIPKKIGNSLLYRAFKNK